MKRIILSAAIALMGSVASADGFICETMNRKLEVKIFNSTKTKATRTAAVMIIADNTINQGRKTVAVFSQHNGEMSQDLSKYYGNVRKIAERGDFHGGEYIYGTRLGSLEYVIIDLDFSYSKPVDKETYIIGWMILSKTNGDQIKERLICTRYLKN